MVTKQVDQDMMLLQSLILAKNHMVTKPRLFQNVRQRSLILAKNHMVTKQLKHLTSFL